MFEVHTPDGTVIEFGTPDFEKRYPFSADVIRALNEDAHAGKNPPAVIRALVKAVVGLEHVQYLRNLAALRDQRPG